MTAAANALAQLSLYVSAIAGRTLGLRWHDEAHGLSYCDGAVIVAAVRGEAAWLDLTLQALLVRHGSLAAHSMRQLVGRPRVFDRQLDFALSLVQALFASGDRTSLVALHSWGAKIVRVVRLLDFDESPDSRLVERARHLSPVGYSRLGAAVRHGTHLLRTRAGTPHRMLIVVSDAFAYDHGYEGAYAHADTRRALAEARAKTSPVCASTSARARTRRHSSKCSAARVSWPCRRCRATSESCAVCSSARWRKSRANRVRRSRHRRSRVHVSRRLEMTTGVREEQHGTRPVLSKRS